MSPTRVTPPLDGSPYCGKCGYSFAGLVDSSKCPECGRPIVEVLQRPTFGRRQSIRYRSTAMFMGVPLIHVALGPAAGERMGHATGVIAVGDIATGLLAIGVISRGVVSFGSLSIGVISFGAVGIGLVALGGAAVGGLALGGFALGGVSVGGCAIGVLRAIGGYALKIPL